MAPGMSRPFRVVAAGHVGDADDLAAPFGENAAAIEPTLPKPCTITLVCCGLQAHVLHLGERGERDPAARRFHATPEPPISSGLPGHDAGDGLAHVHRVGVHEPRHDLRGGADVGRRDILIGPDDLDQFGGVAAGDALEFGGGKLVGIARHPALGAAVRQVDRRALPGHPEGQGRYFVQGHPGMVADAALGRPAGEAVLNAIPGIYSSCPRVADERDRKNDLPLRPGEQRPDAPVQVQHARRFVEVRDRVPENRNLLGYRCHENTFSYYRRPASFFPRLPSFLSICTKSRGVGFDIWPGALRFAQTLNRKFTTSPSCITYSLPSERTRPRRAQRLHASQPRVIRV